jgi:8-oxo-dGTP pyrophosphatase MutT (NUDIX family)/predicted house-cleaning noncanonical NTP pyrophosphatase (MazG superfamily)
MREKLVRDNIPELHPSGAYRVADAAEYAALLRDKLSEETGEYLRAEDPGELADILEVVHALARHHGLDPEDLERLRAAKAAERGGFTRRAVLQDALRREPGHVVRHSVRAILLDGDDLILFKRVRPGRPPYWITPGGGIEPDDASPEAALRRELDEELGATTGPAVPVAVLTEPGARHTVYACRLHALDLSRRSGPEFGDPAMGTHEIQRIPCTAEAIRAVNLVPAPLADFLAGAAATLPLLLDAATDAPGRYRPIVDVHLLLLDGAKILLGRRRNTGYADGEWQIMPSGHLEDGESVVDTAVREAKEELGIDVNPAHIEAAHVMHHRNAGGTARVGIFFIARRGYGTPINAEPHKCAELAWVPMDELPPDTAPYAAAGIQAVREQWRFSLHGWEEPSPAELHAESVRAGYEELSISVIGHRDGSILVLSDEESDRLPWRPIPPGQSLQEAMANLRRPRFVAAEDYVSTDGRRARRFAFAIALPPDATPPPWARWLPAHSIDAARLTHTERRFIAEWLKS